MVELEQKLRQTAHELLESRQVACIIGWGKTQFPGQTRPVFIENASDAGQLVFNEHCLNLLAKYAVTESAAAKIALCSRGCEARAINRLLADGRLQRENLFLIGLPCPGMKDEHGEVADKCRNCTHPNPVDYDVLLGSPVPEQEQSARFAATDELAQLSADDRYAYWQRAYSRCIRCYACRNVCPACNCRACYVEQNRTGWQGKQNNPAQNGIFQLTRVFHMAGRCVECGECERVCPMQLPLMQLNRKLLQDEDEIFGCAEHGLSAEETPLLGSYDVQDLEEFM